MIFRSTSPEEHFQGGRFVLSRSKSGENEKRARHTRLCIRCSNRIYCLTWLAKKYMRQNPLTHAHTHSFECIMSCICVFFRGNMQHRSVSEICILTHLPGCRVRCYGINCIADACPPTRIVIMSASMCLCACVFIRTRYLDMSRRCRNVLSDASTTDMSYQTVCVILCVISSFHMFSSKIVRIDLNTSQYAHHFPEYWQTMNDTITRQSVFFGWPRAICIPLLI